MVKDDRKDKSAAAGYVVFTDKFMSGWGHADGGRSLYAVACASTDEVYTVLANGNARTDMIRARHVRTLRNVRVGRRDSLQIVNREDARRWYVPGAFAK